MISIPEKLDALHCPLNGRTMIEASSGTGKTYTIQILYLRLILEQGLLPEEIVVMTFTEMATAELKSRIRSILSAANAIFSGTADTLPEEESRQAQEVIDAIPEYPREQLQARLKKALFDFDTACISTIHGFCSRILADHAYGSGILFDSKIISGDEAVDRMQKLCNDFMRRVFFSEKMPVFHALLKKMYYNDCDQLLNEVEHHPDLILRSNGPVKPIRQLMTQLEEELQNLRRYLEPELFSGIPVKMNKGYKPKDLREADQFFQSWTEDDIPSASFIKRLQAFNAEEIRANSSKVELKKPEKATQLDEYLKHPFFAANAAFLKTLTECHTVFSFQLMNDVLAEFEKQKLQENFQTYNDLLTRVSNLLQGEDPSLRNTLRKKYKAALIDEFQDTDSVQYQIFRLLFDPQSVLFMVGDPKQAIYGFRGGDIAVYNEAKKECCANNGRICSLKENYRSSRKILDSFNWFFGEHQLPFASQEITYTDVSSGKSKTGIFYGEKEMENPLRIYVAEEKSEDKRSFLRSCAAEILSMLQDPQYMLPENEGRRPLRPCDFAVLVRKNGEASAMREELAKVGIPAVVTSDEKVFASDAAADLLCMLKAIRNPSDQQLFLNALNSRIAGFSLMDLAQMRQERSDEKSQLQEAFYELAQTWDKTSFIQMFNGMLHLLHVRENVLQTPSGERFLTDLLQLREILHKQAEECHLSPYGVIHFLARQIGTPEDSDEYKLLLDTDRAAVTIMTVHKSKGLEFPVVMLPAMNSFVVKKPSSKEKTRNIQKGCYHLPAQTLIQEYQGILRDGKTIYLPNNQTLQNMFSRPFDPEHDPDQLLVKDLFSDPEGMLARQKEDLQENLRLAYVALTRAKYLCVLWHGPTSDLNVLDYLLKNRQADMDHLPDVKGSDSPLPQNPGIIPWQEAPQEMSVLREQNEENLQLRPPEKFHLDYKPHYVISFTSMAPGKNHDDDMKENDPDDGAPQKTGLFSLPSGAITGNAWHAILEKLDFQETSQEKRTELIRMTMNEFGLKEPQWHQLTEEMLSTLMKLPLAAGSEKPFSLSEISRKKRLSELEFTVSFKNEFRTGSIRKILSDNIQQTFHAEPHWNHWDRFFAGGFLSGFTDLIFEHNGKYYIADWKSNSLHGILRNFEPENLGKAMVDDFYFLQYLIYTIALIRQLRLSYHTFDEKDYEQKFGGVFYFFLRGISAENPSRGIWFHKPSWKIIRELEELIR